MAELMRKASMMDVKGLSVITVKKAELLAKIEACRDQHAKDFEEAHKGWKAKVVEELGKALSDAKEGKAYRTEFCLPEPESHVRDYDRVIAMLKMSVDDQIDLPASEFSRYALDEWEWMRNFAQTKAIYSGMIEDPGLYKAKRF